MTNPSVRDYDGDRIMGWFQPDELAVYEHRRTTARTTALEPEKRLMFAVLEDAIVCFQRFMHASGARQRRLYDEAAAWIFEPDDNGVFSFECVCQSCGMSPEFLRAGLRQWLARNNTKRTFYKGNRRISLRGPQRARLRC